MTLKKVFNLIKRHFQNNFILYFILSILILIGIVIGALFVIKFNTEGDFKNIDYFTWIFNYILEGKTHESNIFYLSLLSNIKIVFIIWIFGLFSFGAIGIPLISIWCGVKIGFTVGFLVSNFGFPGFLFSLVGLLIYYLVMIPAILAITAIGLSNSLRNIKYKKRGKNNDDFGNYSILMILFLFLIIIGSAIEGIVTTYFLNVFKLKF